MPRLIICVFVSLVYPRNVFVSLIIYDGVSEIDEELQREPEIFSVFVIFGIAMTYASL